MRFGWFPRQASGDIVLVAIDSPSIEKIGVWPWPRQLHAELIGKLESAGASDIVFDVDFSSPSNPASDQAFADALQKAGGSVVLPAFKQLVGNGETARRSMSTGRCRNSTSTRGRRSSMSRSSRTVWCAAIRSAKRLDGKFLPSVGALLAGKYETQAKSRCGSISASAADSLPTVSYVDVLRGDPAALSKLKGKKVIIGATAIELGDRFNVPNGRGHFRPQSCRCWRPSSILQGRVLRTVVRRRNIGRAWPHRASHGGAVAPPVRRLRALWSWSAWRSPPNWAPFSCRRSSPIILDTSLWHVAIAAYLAAMALDEIDFRGLLGRIAEKRFQRIAMSLGDGLVCADQNGLITVWNPGAVAIFGYQPEEMIGQPLDRICAADDGAGKRAPFSILELPLGALQAPGGKVMELEGRRKNGETFPLEACFSEWQGVDGFQYGAVMRDISVRKREAERIRYLAEHDTLTGLANRNTLLRASGREARRRQSRAERGRLADAGPRQVQADQRYAGSRLRRSAAVRRRRAVECAGRGRRPGRPAERRRIRRRASAAPTRGGKRRRCGTDVARVRQVSIVRRRAPDPRQCQHRRGDLSGGLRRRQTNCSATPTSRSIGPRPTDAAAVCFSSAASGTSSKRGCRSRPSWSRPWSGMNSSSSINRRSI